MQDYIIEMAQIIKNLTEGIGEEELKIFTKVL